MSPRTGLSRAEIAALLAAIAAADPLDAPDRLRKASCLMRRAGHTRRSIISELVPAIPPEMPRLAATNAIADGWTDAEWWGA